MALHDRLAEYAERSSNLIESSPQMDEQNTKKKIIEPLIELLGWDILTSEVELEYSVQMGSGTKKVDYALKLEDAPIVFVEAKGADSNLTNKEEDQLRSYMRQVGVDWGLLSNGRNFQIYRRDHSSKRPNEISLADFSLDAIVENKQPLSALSRKSLETGKSSQIAEKIESVQKAVKALREDKESISEDITRLVTNEIGESVSQRVEDEAKNFIDELISSLEDQAHRTEIRTSRETSQNDKEPGYLIHLTSNGSVIERISGKSQGEAVANLVDYLIEEEELLEQIEVPYVPGTGRGTRALINDEPLHTDGEEMRLCEELERGYYLFTSLSAEDKARYISELPEKVGLECKFVDW